MCRAFSASCEHLSPGITEPLQNKFKEPWLLFYLWISRLVLGWGMAGLESGDLILLHFILY